MIDLGTLPAPAALPPVTLRPDEMDLLVHLLSIDELPTVLDHRSRFDAIDRRDHAFRGVEDALHARGLVRSGAVHSQLATWLRILECPRWEIAVRRYEHGTMARLCIAQGSGGSGGSSVFARRLPDSYLVGDVRASVTAPIVTELGSADALKFTGINAPTAQLGAALAHGDDAGAAVRHLRAIGIPSAEATSVAMAMATCRTYAEIVGITHGDGRTGPVGGPVTVFDTAAGRIVGTSTVAADGTAWTTLSPGTPTFLRQALTALGERLER